MAHPGDADGSQEAGRPETTDAAAGQRPLDPTNDTPSPEPRGRIASIPVLDVVLDPRAPGDGAAGGPARPGARRALSPERTAVYGLLAGLLVMTGTFAVLIGTRTPDARAFLRSFSHAALSPSPAASVKLAESARAPAPLTPAPGPPAPAIPPGKPIPGPWRLNQLAVSPRREGRRGTPIGAARRSAIGQRGSARTSYRLLSAFNGVHKFDNRSATTSWWRSG